MASPDLEAVVRDLAAALRLADMFASRRRPDDAPPGVGERHRGPGRVRHHRDAARGRRATPRCPTSRPAAFIEECEIYEQFGIRPATGKPLNRVDAAAARRTCPRSAASRTSEPEEAHAPHTVGGQAFEFPFGPVRQVGVESLYYGLVTSGEEVVDLYLFTWHKHRGLEWRLRGKTPQRGPVLRRANRGAQRGRPRLGFRRRGRGRHRHPGSPEAAERTRAVALELERLYNHAAAMAALCQSTGLTVGQSAAEIALERLLRLNAAAFGHRYLFGVVDTAASAARPTRTRSASCSPAPTASSSAPPMPCLRTNSFLDRLEATGILTAGQATALGLVGPVARATGLAGDARRCPAARTETRRPSPRGTAGRRARPLHRHARRGRRIRPPHRRVPRRRDRAGAAAPDSREPAAPASAGPSRPEARRSPGSTLGGDGRITRARLRPASARNWRGFDDACRSQNVFTDIPIIEASFWLTVAGMAR